jgi:hypothetical protein
MDKESVSLSFLLLKKENTPPSIPEARGKSVPARIVSDAFSVPGLSGAARYACTPKGLALIPDALRIEQGSLCSVLPSGKRDRKTNAMIMLAGERFSAGSGEKTKNAFPRRSPRNHAEKAAVKKNFSSGR